MKTVLIFLSFFVSFAKGASWHYMGDTGPEFWEKDSPACKLASQSPININSLRTTFNKDLPPFIFSDGYSTVPAGAAYKLKNNGHNAVVELAASSSSAYTIQGGGLPTTYIADQFHFHWGSKNHQGSEHTINGDSYPMEVHIVHHSKNYADLSNAADKVRGLAVLGFFFKVGEHNDAFDFIGNKLGNIEYYGDEVSLEPVPLLKMFPADLTSYWRYSGSLTTPPCYESVIWTVFQNPIIISQAQLDKFRMLYFEAASSNTTTLMVDTFRPVMPLNTRVVYSSAQGTEWDRFGIFTGDASSVRVSGALLCGLLMAILLH